MAAKKKILIILNRLVIGGQALDTIPLIYHLKSDFDILVLYGEKEPDEEEADFLLQQYPGINIKKIKQLKRKVNFFTDLSAYFAVRKEIKKFNCDIVHTHGFKSGLIGRIAAKNAKTPCIIHSFHGHLFHSYYNKFISNFIIALERKLGSITTKIIAISDTQKNELVDIYKIVPAKKAAVIYLGIDENNMLKNNNEKREAFRKEYFLNEQTIAIAIIGRIVEVKNYQLLIDVVEKIYRQKINSPVKFFVIGDGKLKSFVQHELDKKNISWCDKTSFTQKAFVIFTSWVSDIAEAVPGVDVVILTSHNEGTPMSLIEAQFFGKPVVATDVGGVKDTFINNETGYLAPANNPDFFEKKLHSIIDDDLLRKQMSVKAVDFARSRFAKQKEIDCFKILYENCITP